MANQEHLEILEKGVEDWNSWRNEHPDVRPELSNADLSNANLSHANLSDATLANADLYCANLSHADLSRANLFYANLRHADLLSTNFINANLLRADLSNANLSQAGLSNANLSQACLSGAHLSYAYLSGAHLSYSNLRHADLRHADLSNADLTGANLQDADLTRASFVETTINYAIFTGCAVYGISVWDLKGAPRDQKNLYISFQHQPIITVDNLEVAQFIYILINSEKLRDVIKEVTSKVVLILGRFTKERLTVLKALQELLRQYRDDDGKAKYLPVMLDFDPDKASQDFLETVQTIAGMSRFIIADITSPTGVLIELASIIPHWKVPIKLLLDTSTGERPVAMLQPFTLYPWLVRTTSGKPASGYRSPQDLCASVEELIGPIERMVDTVRKAKAEEALGVENLGGGNA
jgi:uncharacterized protein YjbI with pentapeptide repeats